MTVSSLTCLMPSDYPRVRGFYTPSVHAEVRIRRPHDSASFRRERGPPAYITRGLRGAANGVGVESCSLRRGRQPMHDLGQFDTSTAVLEIPSPFRLASCRQSLRPSPSRERHVHVHSMPFTGRGWRR